MSGFKDLMVLKSTGSEFHDFLVDEYTTLVPTTDRILATSLSARWRYLGTEIDWATTYASIRQIMLECFAEVRSLALQQTLYEMGKAALEAHPRSRRSGSPRPTSTTSSTTCRRSGWRTRTRSSTPTTGRTG